MRGQEGDPWKGRMQEPERPAAYAGKITTRDWINRSYMPEEEQMPQAQTFSAGLDFIRTNQKEDRWFLQLETFDPHEPFFAPERFQDLYPATYEGHFDWPPYSRVTETTEQVQHCRNRYAALVSMCDHYLGKVLDLMDELDLWKDTLLIVNTDHGYLLGEHNWWAKLVQPFYNEIAHMPLFIWDPRSGCQGARSQSLVQTIDLPPTLLEFFGVEAPPDMQGICLRDVLAGRGDTREAVLFGVHGGHVNCTDGRHVYMRAPMSSASQPLHEYTLMPTHMRSRFSTEELSTVELSEPFSFTKGCKLLKIPARPWAGRDFHQFGNLLFNVEDDPQQQNPLQDPAIEQRMIGVMKQLMETNDAPPEQYARLGI